ncbi:hypothetical protein M085_3860, partial [Bacteroides fragilis str. 3986 N(B)19]
RTIHTFVLFSYVLFSVFTNYKTTPSTIICRVSKITAKVTIF